MGIHIHDLPEDLDLGQLSTLRGGFSFGLSQPGAFDSAVGIGLEGAAPLDRNDSHNACV